MRIMRPGNSVLILLVFLFYSFAGKSQSTPQEEALQLYAEGKYAEALPVFKRLVTLFPKDPKYQYYSGVCMVQSNTDLTKAVNYLRFASDKAIPRDVYFFLGKAYHYQYRFNEAIDAYSKFLQFGERAEKDRLQCELHIAMARNAKPLLEKLVALDVHRIDSLDADQIFSFYNKNLKNGQFKEKQIKAFPFSDVKGSSWRFIPSLLSSGDIVYEVAIGPRRNKDLVQVRKLNHEDWSRPESMGSLINSSSDEDYVYFNASEPALYFASKGHNSMGGYDIFKSVYDADKKNWSEPINMGFPINTPYDDYLFIPSEDQSKAYFVSNRDTRGNKVKVYTISFSKTRTLLDITSDINFISRSKLVVSNKPVQTTRSVQPVQPVTKKVVLKKEEIKPAPITPAPPSIKSEPEPYPAELAEHRDYNTILQAALQYQLMADSLSRVAENVRQQVPSARNEIEANTLKREIYLLEQKSKTTQIKADELYEKARNYEIEYTEKNRKDKPLSVNSSKTSADKSPDKKAMPKDKSLKKKDFIYEFRVLNKSPYRKREDIPLNQPIKDGLIYRIQMGAFSKPVEADRFKGITPIYGETLQNNVTKFYAGVFSRAEDAEKALIKVRENGFKDAYVVSFYNGKTIPINRAKEIEKDDQ